MNGGITLLLAKAVSTLMVRGSSATGDIVNIVSWQGVVLIVVLTCVIVSQMFWINRSLAVNDALFHIPVFFVVWQCMSMLGGALVYGEFSDMELWRTLLYCLGVAVLLAGVVLSSHRLLVNKLTPSFRELNVDEDGDVDLSKLIANKDSQAHEQGEREPDEDNDDDDVLLGAGEDDDDRDSLARI